MSQAEGNPIPDSQDRAIDTTERLRWELPVPGTSEFPQIKRVMQPAAMSHLRESDANASPSLKGKPAFTYPMLPGRQVVASSWFRPE